MLANHEARPSPMETKQKSQGAKITVSNPQIPTHDRGQHSAQQCPLLGMTILTGKQINRQLQRGV